MKNFLLVAALLMGSLVSMAWGNTDGHDKSVEEVVAEIRAQMGLSQDDPINPELVPDSLMIALGDAVMESYIGDSERHVWMDQMMGGEGSQSLDASHRWMAYRYLAGGYADESGFARGSGMMGRGMMGGMMGRGWGLMGNPDMMYENIPYGSPEQILKRRYAEGEISRQEYREMLREIE